MIVFSFISCVINYFLRVTCNTPDWSKYRLLLVIYPIMAISGVMSIIVHSEINCLILDISSGFKYFALNNSNWVMNERYRFYLPVRGWACLLRSTGTKQYLYRVEYYSHSSRQLFCNSNGSSVRVIDPQYFFKSGPLVFTSRFFKARRIFSREVPFFIIVTIFFWS